MTPRRQRTLIVVGIVAGAAIGVAVALWAFRGNLLYYYTPTQALAKQLGSQRIFRLGGLVEKGSIQRKPGTLTVRFVVTDNRRSMPVVFTGVLPNLFRAGQGVIANGHMGPGGVFIANDVLAKHDAKYMPLKLYNKEKGTAYQRPGAMDAKSGGSGS
ncbi:MAG: cytochrome c maturation protein CcmE [Gammaproteobacteria bacterium]